MTRCDREDQIAASFSATILEKEERKKRKIIGKVTVFDGGSQRTEAGFSGAAKYHDSLHLAPCCDARYRGVRAIIFVPRDG